MNRSVAIRRNAFLTVLAARDHGQADIARIVPPVSPC
jgi:hypothetical protein